MVFKETGLKGLIEIELEPYSDNRGFFVRVYDDKIFEENQLKKIWVQESWSFSIKKGTLRGIHFQRPPFAEAKLISVPRGEVFFTIVDLRKDSLTLGQHYEIVLSEENKKMIFLPRGFALGMCTLTDNCLLHYKIDNYYSAEHAETIRWNDPDLSIKWPVERPTVISEKDLNAESFNKFIETYGGIKL